MLTSGGPQDVDPRLKVILDCHLNCRATILHKIPKRASTARAAGTIILESRADRHAVIMNYLILGGCSTKRKAAHPRCATVRWSECRSRALTTASMPDTETRTPANVCRSFVQSTFNQYFWYTDETRMHFPWQAEQGSSQEEHDVRFNTQT